MAMCASEVWRWTCRYMPWCLPLCRAEALWLRQHCGLIGAMTGGVAGETGRCRPCPGGARARGGACRGCRHGLQAGRCSHPSPPRQSPRAVQVSSSKTPCTGCRWSLGPRRCRWPWNEVGAGQPGMLGSELAWRDEGVPPYTERGRRCIPAVGVLAAACRTIAPASPPVPRRGRRCRLGAAAAVPGHCQLLGRRGRGAGGQEEEAVGGL